MKDDNHDLLYTKKHNYFEGEGQARVVVGHGSQCEATEAVVFSSEDNVREAKPH